MHLTKKLNSVVLNYYAEDFFNQIQKATNAVHSTIIVAGCILVT